MDYGTTGSRGKSNIAGRGKLKLEGGGPRAGRNAECATKGARSRNGQRREFELKSDCRRQREWKPQPGGRPEWITLCNAANCFVGGVETAANSLVEIGPWTRKDSANLK